MATYANQEAYEGTVTSETTINLKRRSRALEIINDSGVRDLQYKFNDNEDYATLRPSEAVSFDFLTRKIILNSIDAAYRIRALG